MLWSSGRTTFQSWLSGLRRIAQGSAESWFTLLDCGLSVRTALGWWRDESGPSPRTAMFVHRSNGSHFRMTASNVKCFLCDAQYREFADKTACYAVGMTFILCESI